MYFPFSMQLFVFKSIIENSNKRLPSTFKFGKLNKFMELRIHNFIYLCYVI